MIKIFKNIKETDKIIVVIDDSIPEWWWDVNNLGYYTTDTALTTAHPTATDWNYAIVWTTDSIWIWDWDTNTWKDSKVTPTVNEAPIDWKQYTRKDGAWTISTSWWLTYSAINSSQAITNWNYYWVTCTGDIILTLADWTSIGQNLSIKKLDNTAYTITITGNIEWETSIIMDTQYESLDLFWNWNYYLIK